MQRQAQLQIRLYFRGYYSHDEITRAMSKYKLPSIITVSNYHVRQM